MPKTIESEVEELLPQWEESYKKGLLSFWILFSLTHRSMYAYEMRGEILKLSQGSISAEENSIYRALRRFIQAGLVDGEEQESPNGPARKYYLLTPLGTQLLKQFIERNLLVFQSNAFLTASQTFLKTNKEN
jgi:DNA-binding PadR family transcriptional regulator